MYLKNKAFKYLKNQKAFSWQFQVVFHMYLKIGRTMAMIVMTENLATKITTSNMMMIKNFN